MKGVGVKALSGLTILVAIVTLSMQHTSIIAMINVDKKQDYFDSDYIRYRNHIYVENIKTVKIHPTTDQLALPVIELGSDEKLLLSFDELDADTKDYTYKFFHCTSNWELSDLFSTDYVDGFEENRINEVEMSFNTYQSYIHYAVEFPNYDVNLKVSGNYVIVVYNDEAKPVLSQRFFVIETLAKVEGTAKRATNLDYHRSHHEVDFTFWSHFGVNDPYRDIKTVVVQNGRWDNAIYGVTPKYIKGNEFIYDYETEILFPGLSEFRHFNLKDVKFASEGIASINYMDPLFLYDLEKSESQRFKVYSFKQDINGASFIDIANGTNMELEADYVEVDFHLAMDAPLVDGNLYVFGELSGWEFPKRTRMIYNYKQKEYQLTLLLKQGYYNYHYAFLKDNEQLAEVEYIEGSHYETENDYHVFIYFRDNSLRYDKLIGLTSVNNVK